MTSRPAQQPHSFRQDVPEPVSVHYLLHLPPGYGADSSARWPLILFLHGAGERGNDLNLVKLHGIARVVEERPDFPFVAVSPQCPPNERWRPEVLAALLDEIETTYRIDPDRIYLTGLSMGGFGAWALAIEQPHRFAAIAPICGGGDPGLVCAIRHVPVWAFHGARDDVVPLHRSQEMVDALRACGGNVRLTVYPDADHDSWTRTYTNPELYDWLLSHRRGQAPTP